MRLCVTPASRMGRALLLSSLVCWLLVEVRAAEHSGRVTFNGVPVPGATVIANREGARVEAVSDADGRYQLGDLADGVWSVRVEMTGFGVETRDIAVGSEQVEVEWQLTLSSFEALRTSARLAAPTPAGAPVPSSAPPPATAANRPGGGARAPALVIAPQASLPDGAAPDAQAADSFLVNGSVNNGAASPFAQMAAFGNNRRSVRSLYNGGFGAVFGNSALDSRPFSFRQQPIAKPSYGDMQLLGTFGGPVRIPGLRTRTNLFLGYQHSLMHNAAAQSALVPTALERTGDFSQSVDAQGQPVVPVDRSGQPFADRRIPPELLSPQAASLLNYYPQPNVSGAAGYNYEAATLNAAQQNSLQVRATHTVGRRDSLFGTFLYSRTRTDSRDLFNFTDRTTAATGEATVNWSRRISQFFSLRLRYQFTGQLNASRPYFANRVNVSGDAGIAGNDQSPENWGPPALTFSSGYTGLVSSNYADNHGRTHVAAGEAFRTMGRHGLTIGGGYGWQALDIFAQQDGRGRFAFTGAFSGSDLADFLLGAPATSAIAFGNADKLLSGASAHAYVNDDWRISPSLTVNAGVRWEYESPLVEQRGRLANIDVSSDFSRIATVVPGQRGGGASGTVFSPALLGRDLRGVQPRVGVAWRPVPGSSLVVRGGYGVYRNSGVYQSLSVLLAQQPPFSKSFSIPNTSSGSLTLANAFDAVDRGRPNTFGVDPNFRVGYAHNWQVSAQRDLPASLTVVGTYLGTSGRHLMQQFLPNTYPFGSISPCQACPNGFVYLTSNGTSLRNAGQIQVRRRLRNGFSATVQYTLAKATDNASAFVPLGSPLQAGSGVTTASGGTTGITGATIAQNWLDLDAEYGRSSFDQRHQVTVEMQYTTGMGLTSGALANSLRGRLLNGWTVTTQLTTGSGLPLTPIVLTPVAGTGFTGTTRATLTGVSTDAPDGYYLNPAAYATNPPGEWGNAARNSVSGPAQFSFNASLGRSFLWGDRTTLDWRLDATNLLNVVTYAGVNTIVGSPQFGLANRANTMRKIQMSLRARF